MAKRKKGEGDAAQIAQAISEAIDTSSVEDFETAPVVDLPPPELSPGDMADVLKGLDAAFEAQDAAEAAKHERLNRIRPRPLSEEEERLAFLARGGPVKSILDGAIYDTWESWRDHLRDHKGKTYRRGAIKRELELLGVPADLLSELSGEADMLPEPVQASAADPIPEGGAIGRGPTPQDADNFNQWAGTLFARRGSGPSYNEAWGEFAKPKGLPRKWSREMIKALPPEHRRQLGNGKPRTA
jgi:hypothetical protein